MTARSTFYEEQTEQALERLARLRERGAVHGESEQQLVAEILEELSIALHELQVSAQELSDQNEQLISAEGSIAAERARYQELYDFAPDGYLVTDLYGVIRDANRMAGELLGVDSEVLVGRPLSMYLPVARRRPFRMLCNEMMDAAAAGDSGVRTLETTFMRPDKMLFVASLRVIAIRRAEGGDPELRWTLRDVSEQRRTRKALVVETYHRQAAEESLRSSEALYRHLVEHATDLVYTLDEHGRSIYCNELALHRMLGDSEKELIGRPLTDLVRRDRRKAVRAFTSAQIRHHGGHSYLEFPLLAKDGREVWVGQHGATTAITGGNSRIQAVSRDITTQVAHVEQLERAGERARDYSAHLQTQIEAERARRDPGRAGPGPRHCAIPHRAGGGHQRDPARQRFARRDQAAHARQRSRDRDRRRRPRHQTRGAKRASFLWHRWHARARQGLGRQGARARHQQRHTGYGPHARGVAGGG